jgi:hypothetical protein
VKFYDFQQITRSVTQSYDYQTFGEIFECAKEKLRVVCESEFPEKQIRLLGVGISNLSTKRLHETESLQLNFFHLL